LYPFGYGLSYSKFEYSDLKLSASFPKGKIVVSVKVKNTGKVTGKEVVQLYIRDLIGSVTRPVKELKGFEMIELKQTKQRKSLLVSITKQLNFILLISGKRNQEILMSLLVVVQQKHCRWIFNILTK
jgi:beta-glucosidase